MLTLRGCLEQISVPKITPTATIDEIIAFRKAVQACLGEATVRLEERIWEILQSSDTVTDDLRQDIQCLDESKKALRKVGNALDRLTLRFLEDSKEVLLLVAKFEQINQDLDTRTKRLAKTKETLDAVNEVLAALADLAGTAKRFLPV